MYFKLKSNIIYRDYGSFGYITDNRNFGYKLVNDNRNEIGDKIVSQSGAVFLSILSNKPQSIDSISMQISSIYEGVNIELIKVDAIEFYCALESEGFIVSGISELECNDKDIRFSYKDMKCELKDNVCSQEDNSFALTQSFFEKYFNNEPQLTNVHVEVTSECNERCVHCYIPHEYKNNAIEPYLFFNILQQCKEMNVLNITISGGEPMMHDSLLEFLQKCNEYNFSVNLLTNLTLLDESFLNEFKKNPLLNVQVSLYSMNPVIHDSITQVKGSHSKTINSIMKLVENDIPLQISCPILKQNVSSYHDVLTWGNSLNINVGTDYVIIARYNHSTSNLDHRLKLDDIRDAIKLEIQDNENYIENKIKGVNSKRPFDLNDFVCSVCNSSLCITQEGFAYPCAGWQDYKLGDLNKDKLLSIWTNSEKVKYLRNLRKRDFPVCIECKDRDFCTMCMVRNANEDPLGDPLKVNEYFCEIVRMNKEIVINWRSEI